MFSPHLSQIEIYRREPRLLNFRMLEDCIMRRSIKEVEKIISKDSIKTHGDTKKTQKKIKNLIEIDERLRTVKRFMRVWNYWREFYFNLPEINPKTKGQLTCIENILELSKKERLNLNMLIATHKAYAIRRSSYMPTYSTVLAQWEDFYEKFYDSVLVDIDREDYEH